MIHVKDSQKVAEWATIRIRVQSCPKYYKLSYTTLYSGGQSIVCKACPHSHKKSRIPRLAGSSSAWRASSSGSSPKVLRASGSEKMRRFRGSDERHDERPLLGLSGSAAWLP
jgi:hypothetical protein